MILRSRSFENVVNSNDLQKIKKTVDNMYAEKQKFEKEQKNKKGNKGKSKVTLRIESDDVSKIIQRIFGHCIHSAYSFCLFILCRQI